MTKRVKYTVIWKELKLLSFLVGFVLILIFFTHGVLVRFVSKILTSTSFPQLFAMNIMIIQII